MPPKTDIVITFTGTQICVACGGIYSVKQLEGLPEEVIKLAAGSGNPTALVNMERGQKVLDIGSGAGIDCFLAARKVGPEGRVIGVDKSPDKIRIAIEAAEKIGLKNVQFLLGDMHKLPIGDESVDVVMSNCVISISKRREDVFKDSFRALKPGGKLVISDAATPSEKQYVDIIQKVGFRDIKVLGGRRVKTKKFEFKAIDVIANKP